MEAHHRRAHSVRNSGEQVRAAVEAVSALIPRLQRPHPSARGQVKAHRTVPREFVASMIAAVER